MYITHTQKVKTVLESSKEFETVLFEINIDGTACLLMKSRETKKYFEKKLAHSEMKQSVEKLSSFILSKTSNYFNKILTF